MRADQIAERVESFPAESILWLIDRRDYNVRLCDRCPGFSPHITVRGAIPLFLADALREFYRELLALMGEGFMGRDWRVR